jgi:hypothetical protein
MITILESEARRLGPIGGPKKIKKTLEDYFFIDQHL